jgi:hypothetical protein
MSAALSLVLRTERSTAASPRMDGVGHGREIDDSAPPLSV